LVFGENVAAIFAGEHAHGLRKTEKQFVENFKKELNKYLFQELNPSSTEIFVHGLWAA
jgi:hypothetical protein